MTSRTDTPLDRLVRWYALAWMDEAAGIEQLHEPHPGPGDLTGAPEWSSRFRTYILERSDDMDDYGYYRKPLHAALFDIARSDSGHYRLLTKLRLDWDAERAAWRCGVHPDAARQAMTGALAHLRKVYQAKTR